MQLANSVVLFHLFPRLTAVWRAPMVLVVQLAPVLLIIDLHMGIHTVSAHTAVMVIMEDDPDHLYGSLGLAARGSHPTDMRSVVLSHLPPGQCSAVSQ